MGKTIITIATFMAEAVLYPEEQKTVRDGKVSPNLILPHNVTNNGSTGLRRQ